MGFKNKYPDNYNRDNAIIELWFQQRRMSQHEVNSIVQRYSKRLIPKTRVTRKQIECDKHTFLVDYTSVSCVTLSTHKNRYLLDKNGDYWQYGFLVAKCVLTNHKFAMLVKATQMKEKDLELFRKLVEKQLGYKIVFVTDNRHNVSLLADKKDTMLIEVEFGGLKRKLYHRYLKPLQYHKNGKIVTLITFRNLLKLYLYRMGKCGITLLNQYSYNPILHDIHQFNFPNNRNKHYNNP